MATAYRGFQLGLLPERKVNKRAVATAYGIVALALLIVINLGLLMPDKLQLAQYHVTELIPRPSLRPEPAPVKKPEIKARIVPAPKLPVFEQPKLVMPKEVRREIPQPVEAPKVVVNQFAPPQIRIAENTVRPQLVHTGDFGQGSSVKPTVVAPVEKVQTGGFGDPNGLKGEGKQGAKLYSASMGSFDMPAGPGQGNGSGGAKGIKGTVASADFGSGVATSGSHTAGQVSTGGFGSQPVAHQGPKIVQDMGPSATPVEITFKPNPVYTDEARNLKLEGEVLLEVSFGANGTLHVNRVVRGLGHGLDEAATAAANKIRFKPAMRAGVPVDSTAVVHVTFQLAY
ncbi:MAG TPA: energy transducer TonB [Candidatus Sulfotelmatobacter sp.]|jgi:TonB family protein